MNKSEMIRFFDMRAPSWDACEVRKDDVIDRIFDNAHICGGLDILDVACGTGVLFPHYIKRNVRSVTAIDISGGAGASYKRAFFVNKTGRQAHRGAQHEPRGDKPYSSRRRLQRVRTAPAGGGA